jgi:tetratricopeptide (TPR) repeat protein
VSYLPYFEIERDEVTPKVVSLGMPYLNVNPDTHIGILRSGKGENEINSLLFARYCKAMNKNSASLMLNRLRFGTERNEAEEAFNRRFMVKALEEAKEEPKFDLSFTGAGHARVNQWKEAATDFFKAIESDPVNFRNHQFLAVALLQCGDVNAYVQLCAKAYERFGNTSNPQFAEQMAKMMLLMPRKDIDLNKAALMAEKAVSLGINHRYFIWFEFIKCLAEYRQGYYLSSAERANRIIVEVKKHALSEDEMCLRVESYMVLAMAYHKMEKYTDAYSILSEGTAISRENLRQPDSKDLGPEWFDTTIAHILTREASALVNADGKSERMNSDTKDNPHKQ